MSDSEKWNFPIRDLSRRKFQTWLTTFSLVVCVSVTVFLVLFGENLGVEITSVVGSGLTVGFSDISSKFIFIVILFNSATGILTDYFLIKAATSERVRDIGIMKAIGCLTNVVYSYFATELLIIVFTGCMLGTIGGIALNLVAIGLMNLLGFHMSAKLPNPWLIMLVLFTFALFSYFLGMRQIRKAAEIEPAKALSPLFAWKTPHQPSFNLPFLSKGFVAKMAFRELGRRRSMTLHSVSCLSVVMILITLVVVGGIVANETTQSYVERAIGRDIILIAKTQIVQEYRNRLERFLGNSQTGQTNQINYLDEKFVIQNSLISNLSAIEGVDKVDPRLVLESTVKEYPYISPDPEDPQHYIVIGDDRVGNAFIIGVYPENLVNDWLIVGKNLSETEQNTALIGDSLSLTLFQEPLKQSFKALDAEFKVAGICLDPLNNGMVVYVSFNRLSAITKHTDYNVALIQVDPSSSADHSRILNEIEAIISKKGLTLLELNELLERQKVFLNQLWSLLLSLSLFSFMNAILSLIGYLMISISSQQKDLSIMRALGAKPKTVIKLIAIQTFLLILAGGIIGLPVGAIIILWFFIPDAVISQTAVLSIAVLLSILIGALCLSSLYPARRITRTPLTEGVYHV